MLVSGWLMLPHSSGRVRLSRGWLMIEGGVIEALGEGPAPGTADLGGDDAVITPGFVDAHLHLPQFDSIGQDGLPLLKWLETVIFPAEMRWSDPAYAASMTRRVIERLIRAGTTSIAAYATVHHEGSLAAAEELSRSGLRAIVGQVLMDQHAPAELCRPAARLINEAAAYIDRVEAMKNPRLLASVNPRFAISCSRELLLGAGELVQSRGVHMQTHLGETTDECELAVRLHPWAFDDAGRAGEEGGYTRIYEAAGLLSEKSLLAHGIYLSAQERSIVRGSGCVVAHCPTANTFLQSGIMPRREYVRSGIITAVGSDVAGGPDVSMPRVARAMIDSAKTLAGPAALRRGSADGREDDARIPTPARAWWQITRGNAEALGLMNAGHLKVGAEADVLVVKPGEASRWHETPDPLGTLLYAWDDRWLSATVVGGRVA
jgi:guanine deaminase